MGIVEWSMLGDFASGRYGVTCVDEPEITHARYRYDYLVGGCSGIADAICATASGL